MNDQNIPATPRLRRRVFLLGGLVAVISACRNSPETPWKGQSGGSGSGSWKPPAVPGGGQAPTLPSKPGEPPVNEVPGDGYIMVPRAAWAELPIKGNNNPMGGVERITIHHTGEHGTWADVSDQEVVRRIERYHRNDRGWACIGYHFLVGRDGRVYEGRPTRYQGAHVSTQNEHNLGISVIGDFNEHLPSRRQLAALKALIDDKRNLYKVGKRRIYGHRELHQSECPGNLLFGWVKSYRA